LKTLSVAAMLEYVTSLYQRLLGRADIHLPKEQ